MSDFIIHNGELYHFGVKGMKWGKRKAKYQAKARTARKSAKDWDEMADFAYSKGKTDLANKYKKQADKSRSKANVYKQKIKDISSGKSTSKGKVAAALAIAGIGATAYTLFSKDSRYGMSAFDMIRELRK